MILNTFTYTHTHILYIYIYIYIYIYRDRESWSDNKRQKTELPSTIDFVSTLYYIYICNKHSSKNVFFFINHKTIEILTIRTGYNLK